jgi:hypothetical protein
MKCVKGTVVWALALALAGMACNSSDGGNVGEAEIRSDAALGAAMQAIALDFAQVLADVAPPSFGAFAEKGTAGCPDGGTADWTDSAGVGFGTLNLNECQIRGVSLSGTLQGTLFSEFSQLSATLSGPLTISGGATTELNVQSLIVSASLPIMDATTFWEINATTIPDGDALCAWSGGGPCENQFDGGGGGETTTTRTGGTCDPQAMFGCEEQCFSICVGEEVAQFTECSGGVCSCTCVDYNL